MVLNRSRKRNILNLRLTDVELAFIESLAEELGITKTDVIRKLLNQMFQIDPEKLKQHWDDLTLNFE